MTSAAVSQGKSTKHVPWRLVISTLLLAVAFIYVWIIPLFQPRGELLWDHYRLKDIYLGIPVGMALLCVVLVLAVPRRYRRSVSLRLTTLAISLLAVLIAFDAFYALVFMGAWRADFWLDQAHISRKYSVADPELGFVRKPGISWRGYVPDVDRIVQYRTDENGFRNPPGQRQADIVFIGDSYTEAATVSEEHTFVRSIANVSGLSAINLSRGAYGPQQELIVLRRYGLAYKPRFVVWQLFEGNDLRDAQSFIEWKNSPGQLKMSLKDRYFNNSLINELLTNTRLPAARGRTAATLRNDGDPTSIGIRYRYDPGEPASNSLAMAETKSAIESGYRLCESNNIQLLVVVIPTMVRVMEPHLSFDREEDRRNYLPEPAPGQRDFSRSIEDLCAQIGCAVANTFEAMSQAVSADGRNPYIPNDEHLDIRGHEIMTKLIVERIRNRTPD
jgi:hypothetical protein